MYYFDKYVQILFIGIRQSSLSSVYITTLAWRCAYFCAWPLTRPTIFYTTTSPLVSIRPITYTYISHDYYIFLILYAHFPFMYIIYIVACVCVCTVMLYGNSYLPVYRFQHSFVIGGDSNRSITNMVVSGMGVWLSLQNSAVLRLVHSITYEILAEVNTAPAVTKMLSSKYLYNIMCVTPFPDNVKSCGYIVPRSSYGDI
jgi:hypothetical protein